MTQPIGGYGRNAYDFTQNDEPAASTGLEFCRNANTVVSGALCDEPTAISKACRSPNNEVDRLVCDDKKMADAQHGLWDATKDAVKMIASILIGRMP